MTFVCNRRLVVFHYGLSVTSSIADENIPIYFKINKPNITKL